MGAHAGQERVGGLVQELDGSGVRLERVVAGQHLDGLLVVTEQVRGLDLEVAPEVADAVAAVERAADDVVQAQAALAVADDQGHVRVERGLLSGGHDGQARPSVMTGAVMGFLRGWGAAG